MTTTAAHDLILSWLTSAPMTAQIITGKLVSHGYPEDTAAAIVAAWLSILTKRGAVDSVVCDGAEVFRAVAEYEQEKEPEVKKSANATWREAIAGHGRKHG